MRNGGSKCVKFASKGDFNSALILAERKGVLLQNIKRDTYSIEIASDQLPLFRSSASINFVFEVREC
ncbi:MAG: hypothetical protein WC682_01965 [Parcubacteria group bacterium]|jgi:hypothetical protein